MPDETDPAAVAARHGFGPAAADEVLRALAASGGGSAQFRHAELGGLGQWSRGGPTMVGDMFDRGLRDRVAALCADLDALPRRPRDGEGGSGGWWPPGLGRPAASGAQDGVRYAFFPEARRLAVERDGRTTLHDTGPRRIEGVAQAGGEGGASLAFRDREGEVRLRDLPEVAAGGAAEAGPDGRDPPGPPRGGARRPEPEPAPDPAPDPAPPRPCAPVSEVGGVDWLALIERLAALHRQGILTDAEFAATKAALLARL